MRVRTMSQPQVHSLVYAAADMHPPAFPFPALQEHLLGKAASLAGATHQQEISKVGRGRGKLGGDPTFTIVTP